MYLLHSLNFFFWSGCVALGEKRNPLREVQGPVPGRPDGHPPLHRGEGQEAGGAGRGDQREEPTAAGSDICQRRTPMHRRWLKNI